MAEYKVIELPVTLGKNRGQELADRLNTEARDGWRVIFMIEASMKRAMSMTPSIMVTLER